LLSLIVFAYSIAKSLYTSHVKEMYSNLCSPFSAAVPRAASSGRCEETLTAATGTSRGTLQIPRSFL